MKPLTKELKWLIIIMIIIVIFILFYFIFTSFSSNKKTFKWLSVNTPTPCSKVCGGGLKYRDVYCWDPVTEEKTDDSNCSEIIDKPSYTETCNDQTCTNWTISDWSSECDDSCISDNKQIREYTCPDDNCSMEEIKITQQPCDPNKCYNKCFGNFVLTQPSQALYKSNVSNDGPDYFQKLSKDVSTRKVLWNLPDDINYDGNNSIKLFSPSFYIYKVSGGSTYQDSDEYIIENITNTQIGNATYKTNGDGKLLTLIFKPVQLNNGSVSFKKSTNDNDNIIFTTNELTTCNGGTMKNFNVSLKNITVNDTEYILTNSEKYNISRILCGDEELECLNGNYCSDNGQCLETVFDKWDSIIGNCNAKTCGIKGSINTSYECADGNVCLLTNKPDNTKKDCIGKSCEWKASSWTEKSPCDKPCENGNLCVNGECKCGDNSICDNTYGEECIEGTCKCRDVSVEYLKDGKKYNKCYSSCGEKDTCPTSEKCVTNQNQKYCTCGGKSGCKDSEICSMAGTQNTDCYKNIGKCTKAGSCTINNQKGTCFFNNCLLKTERLY
jgi:hypothetical protein